MSLWHGTDGRSGASIEARGLAAGSYLTSDLAAARKYAARRAAAAGTEAGVVFAVDQTASQAEPFEDWQDLTLPVWITRHPCHAQALEQVPALPVTDLGPQDELEGNAGRKASDQGQRFSDPFDRQRKARLMAALRSG